ncbi:MAG: heme lyase CcmF/NrfE family subunit [Lautropia sp.]|nr:heme lyase CcmF/NrfE family subunit [Lautropia sp.]
MSAEIGHYALWLALILALLQTCSGLWGAQRADTRLMQVASRATQLQAVMMVLAFLTLAWAFISHDFSIRNVAHNSNLSLPLPYRIAATWGSHEGSMLLWALMLGVWTAAVTLFGKALGSVVRSRVIGVLGAISIGFLLFLLLTSNPFLRSLPAPENGRDLNPLLQDPGMVLHPPMLYLGYVGFSVAFAFAIAAMLGGRVDAAWTRWARPWTIAAWSFLTLGIALGSWWAYYELGWGGWWFWDPVENASFMPWLVGTALMHSLIVTELRGTFRSWTLLLAIATFSLSLVGTFLVRSGVLTSVHAFATDPTRGVFILGFLVVVIGGSLLLYAWKAPQLGAGHAPAGFGATSREGLLLANNLLLVVACAAVFLGTMYPLLLDTLELGKISVGPPYFEAVFFPLMAPAIFLMGIGPVARWRRSPVPDLFRRLRWALAITLVSTLTIALLSDRFSAARLASPAEGGAGVGGAIIFALGVFIGIWSVVASLALLAERLRPSASDAKHGRTLGQRVRALPASFHGMLLAHIGVGIFVLGVAGVTTMESETDEALAPGQRMELGGYEFRLIDIREVPGPNFHATRARVDVTRAGKPYDVLYPEKRLYPSTGSTQTEAAIATRIQGDLYVALGERLPDGRWTVQVWIKPFVDWIWGGCLLMAIGGFIAMADRRYRWRRRNG